MTHSLAAHHAIVEQALRDLLQTYATFFTKDDLYDATEYLDNGEYGLALESLAYVVMHPAKKPMALEEIVATTDADIDFNGIPDLGDEFWAGAKRVEPWNRIHIKREGYPLLNPVFIDNPDSERGISSDHPLAIDAWNGWLNYTPKQADDALARYYAERKGKNKSRLTSAIPRKE